MDDLMEIKYETQNYEENHQKIVENNVEQLNDSNAIVKQENSYNNDNKNIMFVEVEEYKTMDSEYLNLSTTSDNLVLPEASIKASDKTYKLACEKFYQWTKNNNIRTLSENIIMNYINYLKNELTINSLIDHMTVLRTFIQMNYKIDINTYEKINNLWNNIYDNPHNTMESSTESSNNGQAIFTLDDIQKFLTDAPDYHYLHYKVYLIIGTIGACRMSHFRGITLDDFDDDGSKAVMNLKDTFQPSLKKVITNGSYKIFKKYINSRPIHVETKILFLYYSKGGCLHRPIGKDRFRDMTKEIAKYLKLKNPHKYEGKTMRSTSEMLISKFGNRLTELIQPHCNYEIPSVTSSSIAENILNENSNDIEILSDGNSNYSLTNDADGNTMESSSNTYSESIDTDNFNDKSKPSNIIEQNETLFVDVKDKSNDGNDKEIIFIDESSNDDDFQSNIDTSDPLLKQNCALSTKPLRESSNKVYEHKYNKFKEWMKFEKINDITEDAVLKYIDIMRKKFAPATASQNVTMLRYTINKYHNIDICNYPLVQCLARELHFLWKNKITNKLFNLHEIQTFLLNAPDSPFLLIKAVIIMCLTTPCTNFSCSNMTINDIEDTGSEIKLIKNKSQSNNQEIISGKLYSIFKKYITLRPVNAQTDKLFVYYHKGHNKLEACGKRIFERMSKQIAEYLELPNLYEYGEKSLFYTALSLRRNCNVDGLNNFNYNIFKTKASLALSSPLSLPAANNFNSGVSLVEPISTSTSAAANNFNGGGLFVKTPLTSSATAKNNCNDDGLFIEPPLKSSVTTDNCNDDVMMIPSKSTTQVEQSANSTLKTSNNSTNGVNKVLLKPTAELFTSADNKTLYIEISNSKGMDVCIIQK
ncbi:hypothetical protein HCN44_001504 [Aphidius gifuensis]|uniref:Uncharacterized protein n=1 Tax=Aphidius gifuensis TaxID=684658 RepID=A0A835CQV3_APHGI|nr:hypothetical protein HCN44_001504 [Aphidius gifuensis]